MSLTEGASPSHSEQGSTLTRLKRDTARETQVLKSSGFFLQRQVMRLTAAVTTPCKELRHEGPYAGCH